METSDLEIKNLEKEQEIIVKFLTLSNGKNIANIRKRLVPVYKDNVVSIEKVQVWYSQIRGNEGNSNKKKRTTSNREKGKVSATLHKTEEPWRRSQVSEEGNSQLLPDNVEKIQGLLNKLTEKNFTKLLMQMQLFPKQTDDYFKKIVKVILLYVCDEHRYSNLYAKLCEHLYYKNVPPEQEATGDVPMHMKFRQILYSSCIEDLKLRLDKIESVPYKLSYMLRYRLEGLNLFMSELYMLQVLPLETFHDDYLLPLFDLNNINLYKIECFCICLNKLGKYLEVQSNKSPVKFKKEFLDLYFTEINKLMETKPIQLTTRIYYMMKDLFELRQRNWIPRLQGKLKPQFFRRNRFRNFNQNNKNFINRKKTKSEDENISNGVETVSTKTEKPPSVIKSEDKSESKVIEWTLRSSMNKMTDVNFISLLGPLIVLPMEPYLPKIITLIVEKASKELLFSHLYAELCRQLCSKKLEISSPTDSSNVSDKQKVEFKELLLNECNKLWRNYSNYEEPKIIDSSTEFELFKFRLMSRGLAKFIAELYKVGIIINTNVKTYLDVIIDETKQTLRNIELLCHFFTFIGKDLEKDNKDIFDQYFSNVKKLYDKKPMFPYRIRFMLLDLLELHENNWLPRIPSDNLEECLLRTILTDFDRNKQSLKVNKNRNRRRRTPRGKRQMNSSQARTTEEIDKSQSQPQQQQQKRFQHHRQRRPIRIIKQQNKEQNVSIKSK